MRFTSVELAMLIMGATTVLSAPTVGHRSKQSNRSRTDLIVQPQTELGMTKIPVIRATGLDGASSKRASDEDNTFYGNNQYVKKREPEEVNNFYRGVTFGKRELDDSEN
ncbi:hypothetical protein F5Y15DRAFT_380465 [Xylariaceae sp. FL0016]|nr:hypothetical protein F5Y15DRAFT_380465 [Xylariaceae sp. FL0016]